MIWSDGLWYYSYLPAVFIYNDLTYDFLPQAYKANYQNQQFVPYPYNYKGKPVNKFFAGEAFLLAPFFLVAHASSYMAGYPPDGYSLLYQISVWLAAVFYVVMASRFLFKLLRSFEITAPIAAFTTLIAIFGTNLFYYVFYEPSFSHAYSFFAVCGFLWHSRKLILYKKPSSIILACAFLGLIFLIRPINILIIVMLPFLAENFTNLKSSFIWMIKKWTALAAGLGVIFIMGLLQMILWKLQTGEWLVWAYGEEKFDFARPHMLNILFSYKKGLFIYTPLTFLSLAGLVYFFRNNKPMFYNAIFFILLLAYVLSSWWSWWYAMSFGLRAFIDFFPVFFIFFAFIFKMLKNKMSKIALAAAALFLVYVNQVQAYQYRYFILHWDSMDEQKYWQVFLRTDDKYRGMLWSNNAGETLNADSKEIIKQFDLDFESSVSEWRPGIAAANPQKALSGKWFGVLDSLHEFGPTLILQTDTFNQGAMLVEADLRVYLTGASSNGNLVISTESKDGKPGFYSSAIFPGSDSMGQHKWLPVKTVVKIDNIKKGDILKAYIFNSRHTSFYVDNISVKVFKP